MEPSAGHESVPQRKRSQGDDLVTRRVFCPHCKVHVSRRTFYRHQAVYDDAEEESDRTFMFGSEEDLGTGNLYTFLFTARRMPIYMYVWLLYSNIAIQHARCLRRRSYREM